MKRIIDILLSAILLAVFLPLGIAAALLIMLDSKGAVIYKSRRMGLGGSEFYMYKFRTMLVDSDALLNDEDKEEFSRNFKLKNDPRITRVGGLLRRWSIDELPQFLNVLMGNMSLVGPRPKLPEEIHLYGEKAEKLLSVKPGMTGYWQVQRKSSASDEQMRNMDLYYIEKANWKLDTRILFKSALVLLRSDND